MNKNILETLMGAIVLIVAGAFLTLAYKGSEMHVEEGYVVSAKFTNASGISLGSDVRIGGIKIGVISNLTLDPKTYDAVVSMQIRKDTKIPKDSSAAIVSNGLLGEKYIQITPGADDKMLAEGGKIEFTQSGVNLEEMIGKFMFSGGGVDKDKKPAAANASGSDKAAPGNSVYPMMLRIIIAVFFLMAPTLALAEPIPAPPAKTDLKSKAEVAPTPESAKTVEDVDKQPEANAVVLQGLNKVTGHVSKLEGPLGTVLRFGNLEIIARRCVKSAPEERPENAALLEIQELKPGEAPKKIFLGWMFSSSPGLSGLEHPVYDVNVLSCEFRKDPEKQ